MLVTNFVVFCHQHPRSFNMNGLNSRPLSMFGGMHGSKWTEITMDGPYPSKCEFQCEFTNYKLLKST